MSKLILPRPPRVGLGTTTTTGAAGERLLTKGVRRPRPKGDGLRNLLRAMADLGFPDIPPTGFDAVEVPLEAHQQGFTFLSGRMVEEWCDHLRFVEIKTCTQERVDDGFGRFMFSIPHAEIRAAEILGPDRYTVVLHNALTGRLVEFTMPELLDQASSQAWQLSIQLAPTEVVWEGPDILDMFGSEPEPLDVFDLFGEGGGS